MNREKVSEIIKQIGKLEQKHCEGCEVVSEYREQSQTGPTHLCIRECPIGKQIREWGKELEKLESKKIMMKDGKSRASKVIITKEQLTELLKDHTSSEIAAMFHCNRSTINRYRAIYNLKGKPGRPKKEEEVV